MKKIVIICAGKIKEKYLNEGINEYLKRLNSFCKLSFVEVNDFADDNRAIERESDLILKAMQKANGYNVLLDIDGEILKSEEFSTLLCKPYLKKDTVTFIIGGSQGVDEQVKKEADVLVSFGKMTFAHKLMRLILCEQIYRGFCIINKTPYHK